MRKKRREEAESRQRGVFDVWIKRSRMEVDKARDEAAENSSDTSIVSQRVIVMMIIIWFLPRLRVKIIILRKMKANFSIL